MHTLSPTKNTNRKFRIEAYFSELKQEKKLSPQQIIIKYQLMKVWDNTLNITDEIDTLAYNL